MSMSVTSPAPPVSRTSNVRLVAVDEHHQPRYLLRAAELSQALVAAAAEAGIEEQDMPALHGMCIQAARSAEQHGR